MPPLPPALLPALLLALVQGATELLPVSSSGHLVLLGILLGNPSLGNRAGADGAGDTGGLGNPGLRIDDEPFFVISFLHLATALAVVIYWRRLYWQAARGIWQPGPSRRFLLRYATAQAVTAAAALPWMLLLLSGEKASDWGASLWTVGIAMLANAAALLLAPRQPRQHQGAGDAAANDDTQLPSLDWRTAGMVGLAQGLSVLPGLSRSGLTMAAGLRAGLPPGDAARLSYLLAAPVMLAAALFWAIHAGPVTIAAPFVAGASSAPVALALTVAMAGVAFVVAMAGIRWTTAWVGAGRLWWFAPWSAGLGIITLALALARTI